MCFEREDEREEGKEPEQREGGRQGENTRAIAEVSVVILALICVRFYQRFSLFVHVL